MKVEATFHGDRKVFGVSAFNQGIGIYLRRLPSLWVEGEVTDLRRNEAWAFVFFTLKDPETGACVRATMPRRRFDELALELSDGERVLVEGKAEIYEAKGELSFRATTIERVGLGDHLAAIERLKRVLAAEGLFAAERKRPLPRFPRAVGVVTGADAAARGDVIASIRARFPAAHIVIAETRVQGASAGARIAAALGRVAAHPAVDVVIVTRGGGSFEDLLPFSDEVGRARGRPLPGAGRLRRRPRAGHAALRPRRRRARVDPDRRGPPRRARPRRADRRARAAPRPARRRRSGARSRATASASSATGCGSGPPASLLLERRRVALDHAAARLQALSPRATLARGYAVVRSGGSALKDAGTVAPGNRLEIELATGGLAATVDEVRAVSNGEARRADVRGPPPRAGGDRRQARARRRRRSTRRSSSGNAGEALHRRCAALLEAAEGRIEELSAGPPDDSDAPGL